MSINGIDGAGGSLGPGSIRSNQTHETTEVSSGNGQNGNGRTAPSGDRVEISDAARALSAANVASSSGTAPAEQSGGLTAERLQAVLTRMQDGFYDNSQIQEATVRSLISDLHTL